MSVCTFMVRTVKQVVKVRVLPTDLGRRAGGHPADLQ